MRHMATPPLVLEIGQKLWQYYPILTTVVLLLRGEKGKGGEEKGVRREGKGRGRDRMWPPNAESWIRQ